MLKKHQLVSQDVNDVTDVTDTAALPRWTPFTASLVGGSSEAREE